MRVVSPRAPIPLTAASGGHPIAVSSFEYTWCPWPRSGSHRGSSAGHRHSTHPYSAGSMPRPPRCSGSRSGCCGNSAGPGTAHLPGPSPVRGAGRRWGAGPSLVFHRTWPSHCRCSLMGNNVPDPHSTQRGAAGSRPSPLEGWDSRSVHLGIWCAGHNPQR